jgi:hypothetical protein
MEFKDYAAARDLFYLAVLFAGAGIGCVLNRFRLTGTLRFRNRTITLALCLFSGMVTALAAALIYSNGLIVFEKPLYIPAIIIAVLLVLAVRFPRAAGFPLILVSGCAVIWIGYSFLQFPSLDTGEPFLVSFSGEGQGQYAAHFASGGGTDPKQSFVMYLAGEEQPGEVFLEFCFVRISYAPSFPLIGGTNRGSITEIRSETEVFYADPRFSGKLLRGWYTLQKSLSSEPGNRRLLFEESRKKVPVVDILSGAVYELSFGGAGGD